MGKFLDNIGLETLWAKIKSTFAKTTEVDDLADGLDALMEAQSALEQSQSTLQQTVSGLNGDNLPIDDSSGSISIKEAVESKMDTYTANNKFATKDELSAAATSVMHYKGTVASYSNLPTSNNVLGDVYNVTDTGANYAWNGTAWDELSGVVDLSGYVTETDADNIYLKITDAGTIYLTKNTATNTYVPIKSIKNAYQAVITNSDASFTVNASLSDGTSATVFKIAPSGTATINDNQIMDVSMALTDDEINEICV